MVRRNRTFVGAAGLALIVSACATGDANQRAELILRNEPLKIAFAFRNDPDARNQLLIPRSAFSNQADAAGWRADDQAVISKACDLDAGTPKAALPAIATFLIGQAAKLLIDYVSAALEKHLQEYSAQYSVTAQFYSDPTAAGPMRRPLFYAETKTPTLSWTCLRVYREAKQAADGGQQGAAGKGIVFDFIVAARVSGTGDSILLRPIRLYIDQPVARWKQGGDLGLAMAMKFDAIWRPGAAGETKQATVFNQTIAKVKVDGAKPKRVFYFDPDKTQQVPLVPWSINAAVPGGPGGIGQLTVAVAEAGDPPALLQILSKIVKDNKKEVGELLSDAITGAFERQ